MKIKGRVKRLFLLSLTSVILLSSMPGSTIAALASEPEQKAAGQEEADGAADLSNAPETQDTNLQEETEVTEKTEVTEEAGNQVSPPAEPEMAAQPELESKKGQEPEKRQLGITNRAGGIITSMEDTQNGTDTGFSITLNLSIPANGTGNKVLVDLPAGIKVVTPPEVVDTLTGFESKENLDGSTTFTMTLKDNTSGQLQISIGLSQEEFIKTSPTPDYTIKVSFQNDQGNADAAERTFTAVIDYEKEVTAEVKGSIDGFFIVDNNAKWTLEIQTGFNLTGEGYKGEVVLAPETFDKLRIKDGGPGRNPDGSATIQITPDMKSGERTLSIPLPLEVDKDKINDFLKGRHQFTINGNVTFASGQTGTFSRQFENIYLTTQSEVGFPTTTYNKLFEFLRGNVDAAVTGIRLYANYKGTRYEWTDAHKKVLNEYFSRNGVISFQLPEYMLWEGNGIYDKNTNTVELSKSELSVTLDGYKTLFLEFIFKAKIKYDPSLNGNLKDITKENFRFINMSFAWGEGSQKESFFYSGSDNSSIFGRDSEIFVSSGYQTVKQGSSNVLLGGINYNNSKDYCLPPYEYSFDFNQTDTFKDGRKMSYVDFFYVRRMEADMDFFKDNLMKDNIAIYYATNQSPRERLWDVYNKRSIELGQDEWLTSFRLVSANGRDSAAIKRSDGAILSFYGDVRSNGYGSRERVMSNTKREFLNEPAGAAVKYGTGFSLIALDIIPEKEYEITETFQFMDLGGIYVYPEIERQGFLQMSALPESEKADEITYRYIESNTPSRLRIRKIEQRSSSAGIKQNIAIEYTTKNNPNTVTTVLKPGDSLFPGKDDYFTMLKFTRSSKYDTGLYFQVYMPAEYAPENLVVGTNKQPMFEIVDTPGVSGRIGVLGLLYPYNLVSQSAVLGYGDTKTSINLQTVSHGAEKKIPMRFSVSSSYAGLEAPEVDQVINPVFYIEIPKDFEFSRLVFSDTLAGKTPDITTFAYNGKSYVKVRFYGEPGSATGFKSGSLSTGITLYLKAKKFAGGGKKSSQPLKAFVDQSESLERFKDDAKRRKVDFLYTSDLVETSVYDAAEDRNIRVISDNTESTVIHYEVLQQKTIMIEASVNKAGETAGGNRVTVKSGEVFDAEINIYNGFDKPMTDFVLYVPIPQGKGDEWKARLVKAGVDATSTVSVWLSTDQNPTMNELNGGQDAAGMYQGIDSIDSVDYSKVTMMKLKSDSIPNSHLITLRGKFTNAEIPAQINSDGLRAVSEIKYAYTYGSKNEKGNQNITATLVNTDISGKLFLDADEDGILDKNEEGMAGKTVKFCAKDGTVKAETESGKDGYYTLTVPGIADGDYVMVDSIQHRRLTTVNMDADAASRSWFNVTTGKADPTLKNAGHLNAGFIATPEITLEQKDYTIRLNKSARINFTVAEGAVPDIKFISENESIAAVDFEGIITAAALGTTRVKAYYTTISGVEVSSTANITVETNDPPEITAPKVLTMNVGDPWNPTDEKIVEGLRLKDDHDIISSLDQLTVTGEVPVDTSKFLFFFDTKQTGSLNREGTYKVTYRYTDKDNNTAEHEMILKVNGQPYMEDLSGKRLSQETMPDYYYRVGTAIYPFQDVKAFYDRAGDTVGEEPIKTEISSADETNGVFTVKDTVDHEGNTVVGSPSAAGKYKGTYYIKTASEAKSEAKLEIDRTVYAQGIIRFTGNSIAYSGLNPIKTYKTWKDFYDAHKDKLGLQASVETPLQDGRKEVKNLLSTVKVIDPETKGEIDFSKLDFSLPENGTYKEIKLTLQVTDPGKAAWATDGGSVYGELDKTLEIVVTVQKVVGEAPRITVKPIERIENDQIRDVTTTTPEKDLSTEEAMAEAELQGLHPLWDRLLNDVIVEDETPPEKIIKNITGIRRTSKRSDISKKDAYNPDLESEIKEMMNTVGTYAVAYEVIDGDGNRIVTEREIHVAGKTKFVSKIGVNGNPDEAAEASVSILQSDTPYAVPNIQAYHIDSDETTKHPTTVTTKISSVDAATPGTYEIEYHTGHHYENYPDSATPRPKEVFRKNVLVHGLIRLNTSDTPQVLEHWIDEAADLSGYKATYLKAQGEAGKNPIETDVKITSDLPDKGLSVTSDKAAEIQVTLHADAGQDSKIQGHEISFVRNVRFYGLPYIAAEGLAFTDGKAAANVKEGMTEDEIKSLYKFSIKYDTPEGTSEHALDSGKDVTLTKMSDTQYILAVKASAAIDKLGNTREAQAEVTLNVVPSPVITTTKDVYTRHTGDLFDLKQDTGLAITGANSIDNIAISYGDIKGQIPKDTEDKLAEPGTYKVIYSHTDAVGNDSEKTILIKVHGLPEITGIADMEKRVGDSINIWENIQVNWMKAPETEGFAFNESFNYADAEKKGAVLKLTEMKNENNGTPVDSLFMTEPGYYSGVIYANTPSGAEASEKYYLKLHGRPVITVNDIVISDKDTAPENFLTKYAGKLGIVAKVSDLANDNTPAETDLSNQVTVETNEIKYGQAGTYKVVLSVTDTYTVAGSVYNTVKEEISVTVESEAEFAPTISTPSRSRVAGDPIGEGGSGKDKVAEYLAGQLKITAHPENSIANQTLIGMQQISGPGVDKPIDIGIGDNEALKTGMNTPGVYEAKVQIKDKRGNTYEVKQRWEVVGAVEFGFGSTDTDFKKLEKDGVLNVRQGEGNYTLQGLRARYQDSTGVYHYLTINDSAETKKYDISQVTRHEISVSSNHPYNTYENNQNLLRPADVLNFKLLVQGRIVISGTEDLHTRVGSKPDLLKDVKAVFTRIDETGALHDNTECTLEADILDTDTVGKRDITIRARDEITGALPNETTAVRTVYVESVPNLSFNEKFNVPKNAEKTALEKGLQLEVSYEDAVGKKKPVEQRDIAVDFSKVKTDQAGAAYEIGIKVTYLDNKEEKTITRTAQVYVLNDPSYIVTIPKSLELKDTADQYAAAQVDITLIKGVDTEPGNVPAVKVYPDTEVTLSREGGSDSYTAQTYLSDKITKYSSRDTPIAVLKYGTAESGFFYLKTKKDDSKGLGKYKGILHIIFKYEGDLS